MTDYFEVMPTEKSPSRRDFLKLSTAGLLALLSKGKNPLELSGYSEKENIIEIETPNARYFPVYEVHTNPASGNEIEKLPKLNLFFYEALFNAKELMQDSAYDIINRDMSDTLQATSLENKRAYLFPREQLEIFQRNGTEITLEGYDLPEENKLSSILSGSIEPVVGTVGSIAYLAAKALHAERNPDKKFLPEITDVSVKSALAWLLAPVPGLMTAITRSKTEVELSAIQRIASRVSAIATHIHPEDHLTFFRNLMMARKLQFLGKFLAGENFSKPKIGYNIGFLHGGVEDFLNLSPDITLGILNAYPAEFWQKIVDTNGGVETFCSSILLTPDTKHPKKNVVQDKDLRLMLENKLSQTNRTSESKKTT